MEGLQIAANKNIQIAFYLPDNLLPNGSIFHISTNVLAVNGGVRDVALSRRNIRLFFGFSAFLLLLLLLITSVVFNSVQPYGVQPARFLCPWDSLGRSTGVGCHAGLLGIFLTQGSNPGLLYCRLQAGSLLLSHQGSPLLLPCCCCCLVTSVVFDSSQPHGLQPTRLFRPWDFPGKSTEVGCHCLLRPYLKTMHILSSGQKFL